MFDHLRHSTGTMWGWLTERFMFSAMTGNENGPPNREPGMTGLPGRPVSPDVE
jgi:hypothetical protein